MELTFHCVPNRDQVPIPGKVTWILVENLEKAFTFKRSEALLVKSQAWVRYLGPFTQKWACSGKADSVKQLDVS